MPVRFRFKMIFLLSKKFVSDQKSDENLTRSGRFWGGGQFGPPTPPSPPILEKSRITFSLQLFIFILENA